MVKNIDEYRRTLNALCLNNEIWQKIPNCISFYKEYEASSLGRIRSCNKSNSKIIILSPYLANHWYLSVHIHLLDGKSKLVSIHRLIAKAFLKNPLNLKEIHHKDGNKQNNELSNLEYVSHSLNMKLNNFFGYKPIGQKKIAMYDLSNHYIKSFNSLTLAAKFILFKFKKYNHLKSILSNISVAANSNMSKTAYNYKWKYL